MNDAGNFTPEKYSTVCPYLMVEDVDGQMEFLKSTFVGEVVEVIRDENGLARHGEYRTGNSVIMLGLAREGNPARKSMNFIFVANADASYDQALKAGGKSLQAPKDQFYGVRECGVQDPFGNDWFMAEFLEEVSQEELERRMKEQADS